MEHPAGKTSIAKHQNTTDAGLASDWLPARLRLSAGLCFLSQQRLGDMENKSVLTFKYRNKITVIIGLYQREFRL